MLRSARDLEHHDIDARDGSSGTVSDLLFDDQAWHIRWLVVDTRKWLPGRKVILGPDRVQLIDGGRRRIQLDRTMDEIEQAPSIAEDQPLSRQMEAKVVDYYGGTPYWNEPLISPLAMAPASVHPVPVVPRYGAPPAEVPAGAGQPQQAAGAQEADVGDPALRSFDEVRGYAIHARNGSIGELHDLIVETVADWPIRYAVVDTRKWLPGKKVLVALGWIKNIDWRESAVHVDLEREAIKNSPECDPAAPVNRAYETKLYDYYGRRYYWG